MDALDGRSPEKYVLKESRDVHVSANHLLLYDMKTLICCLILSEWESLNAQQPMLF